MTRTSLLAIGISAVIAATWIWHGPMGAADRFAAGVEGRARAMLDHYEMNHVEARLERGPLTRRVVLSGPADDFQRREIERMVETQAGVGEAGWSPSSLQSEARQ